VRTSFDDLLDHGLKLPASDFTRGIAIIERVLHSLRIRSRFTIRGNYSPKQKWLGAGNRWRCTADREAYYSLYRLLADLKKSPSFSKIPKT